MVQAIATAYRNAGLNAIVDLLDSGAGEPSLEFRTAADAVLMTIGLNATAAFGNASVGVATANAPTTGGGNWASFSQNPSASGTLEYVAVLDANGAVAFELTAGTSGAEVIVDSLIFDTGIAVTATVAPTLTFPAS